MSEEELNSSKIIEAIKENWHYDPDRLTVTRIGRQWYVTQNNIELNPDDLVELVDNSVFIIDYLEIATSLSDSDASGHPISCLKITLKLAGDDVIRYIIPSQLYINTK